MANFIEEFYYGNLDPQARSTKENKTAQKQMEVLMLNEDFLTEHLSGESKKMFFKEKKSTKATATIFLRLLDSGKYFPLLRVTDLDGQDLLCKDLPETIDLNIIGEIQLSAKKSNNQAAKKMHLQRI